MNPWTLIGWTAIGFCVFMVAQAMLRLISLGVAVWWLYRNSRNMKPEVGQCWARPDGYRIYVRDITEGTIHLCSQPDPHRAAVSVSWGESPTMWHEKVRSQRRFYIESESTTQ